MRSFIRGELLDGVAASLAGDFWNNFDVEGLLQVQHVADDNLEAIFSVERVRTDSPQMADDYLRLVNCEEFTPQVLNQGLFEELQSLSYVVFFKNVVAGALDVLKVECNLMQISAV